MASKKKASKKASGGGKSTKKGAGKAPSKPAKKPAKPAKAPPKPKTGGKRLGVGDAAPAFELLDQTGKTRSSGELSGKPYVLYFYPKDDTPGCTREACGFRDDGRAFRAAGVRVVGVSPDSEASHKKFADKYSLDFTLLSDSDKKLAQAYGSWTLKKNYGREYMGIDRSTFLVGADGTIKAAWRGVKVDGHIQKVLLAAGALG